MRNHRGPDERARVVLVEPSVARVVALGKVRRAQIGGGATHADFVDEALIRMEGEEYPGKIFSAYGEVGGRMRKDERQPLVTYGRDRGNDQGMDDRIVGQAIMLYRGVEQ